ncbi:MAG: glycosyltransferase family 2 protein [Chloroflexota bacterium]|nr:MAG: glycosyltransferase family 2 protein [Chloroflexota bacterium]
MRLSVVIPAFNEEGTILALLERVRSLPIVHEIVVVDDRSTDRTGTVLRDLGWPELTILHHEVNQGKGAAIRTALAAVTGDAVVIQDADLEYDPSEYPRLLAPLLSGSADVVYGSRFLGRPRRMTFTQWLGNRGLTFVTNALYGTSLTDMETCYKLLPTSIARSLDLQARRYDVEPEITAKLLRAGYRIVEVPISYEGRDEAAGKKIRWTDGIPAVQTLVSQRFRPAMTRHGAAVPS